MEYGALPVAERSGFKAEQIGATPKPTEPDEVAVGVTTEGVGADEGLMVIAADSIDEISTFSLVWSVPAIDST